MKKKHLGSNFDDFLESEGILEEARAAAIKFQLARDLQRTMKQNHWTKMEVARRLQTSRPAVDRLLNAKNTSITLMTMSKVAGLLGKRLSLSFRSESSGSRPKAKTKKAYS